MPDPTISLSGAARTAIEAAFWPIEPRAAMGPDGLLHGPADPLEVVLPDGSTIAQVLDDVDRLRSHTEHLAGALERATVGQQDPVALRLGTRPVDTGPQPAPDLPEMRRLMDARREAGCVAASVWLHDLQWILDRLAQLSADTHTATHLDSGELDHG